MSMFLDADGMDEKLRRCWEGWSNVRVVLSREELTDWLHNVIHAVYVKQSNYAWWIGYSDEHVSAILNGKSPVSERFAYVNGFVTVRKGLFGNGIGYRRIEP